MYYFTLFFSPMETKLEIFYWDNGEIKQEDIKLEDFWEVMEFIKKMPKLDTIVKHYSQYSNMEYYTWCTIMSAINAVATITNKDFTEDEIKEVYDVAQSLWRTPWYWWSRWAWLNAVRKRWNVKYPDPNDQFMTFTLELFSDEFYAVIKKLGILNISINVDSKYRKDARDNLKIDGEQYGKGWGHATTMMKLEDYKCVDSIPAGTNLNKPMIYAFWDKSKIETLIKNGNLRKDCHIIIMNNRLKKEINNIERTRLIWFKSRLEEMISANSWIWENTNNESEKIERNRQNIYNRAKLKIINAMLS